MKRIRTLIAINICTIGLLLSAQASLATPKPIESPQDEVSKTPEFDRSALTQVKVKFFDEAAKHPSKALNAKNIYIDVGAVTFDSHWHRDFKTKLAHGYQERIQADYAELLKAELKSGFAEAGFNIVENREAADAVIYANLNKLRINGPEFTTMTRTYVRHAGSAELQLSIVNQAQELVMHLRDSHMTREGIGMNDLDWATRASNHRDFKHLMQRWAKRAASAVKEEQS